MDGTSGVADLADSPSSRAMPAVTAGHLRPGAHPTAGHMVTAAVIGLCALSVALAAPAAAHGPHGGGTPRPADATAVHEGDKGSTPAPSSTQNLSVDPRSVPPTVSPLVLLSGHDKCKKSIGDMPSPPWCTDPSAGWIWTSLHRADASYPTLPAAKASSMSTAQHVSRRSSR